MLTFNEIPEAVAILRNKQGVFKQTSVFSYHSFVFAKMGHGFVRIGKINNSTSHPSTILVDLDMAGQNTKFDEHGRRLLCAD